MKWLQACKTKFEWFDWVMIAFRAIVLISVLYNASVVQDKFSIPFWMIDVGVGLSFIVPFLLLQRNLRLYIIGELFFLGLLTPLLAPIDATAAGNLVTYILGVGFYQDQSSRRWSIPLATVVLLLGPVTVLFESPITYISIVISGAVFYSLGFIFHALLASKKELQKKNDIIELQNKTLTQYIKQVEQNTVLQERNRISTELQISVSHTFAALMLQLESVRNQLSTTQAEPLVRELVEYTRKGLQQVREAVAHLEPLDVELSLAASSKRMIGEFQKETARNVMFAVKGEEPSLSKQLVLTFSRCLQELLTSSVQTGGAHTIGVTLSFTDAGVELRVEDDGSGTEADRLEAGLNAIIEPLSLLDGELKLASFLNKGMTALCIAPLTKDERTAISVLIADSNPLVRESLVTLFHISSGMDVIGQSESREETFRICAEKLPDVILLDVKIDDAEGGVRLTQQLKQVSPSTKIMIMTNRDDIDEAVASIDAGAEGYIGKQTLLRDLATKIQLVHMGETIISQTVAKQLILRMKSSDAEKNQQDHWKQQYSLTDRETEVLKLLAEGLKCKEISEKLFLAEGTVRNYISNIYSKLEVKDRNEALLKL